MTIETLRTSEQARHHMPRALFTATLRQLGQAYGDLANRWVITIVDQDGEVTVTNDADAVVDYCARVYGPLAGRRIIYRDTEGVWDELEHDGGTAFLGFAPIRETSLELAVARVAATWP